MMRKDKDKYDKTGEFKKLPPSGNPAFISKPHFPYLPRRKNILFSTVLNQRKGKCEVAKSLSKDKSL